MSVTIIDVGAGNLHSVRKACAHVAENEITITTDPDVAAKAERILLPGVGAFGDCMAGLAAINGMRDALEDAVLTRGTPFLGICVGMQMLFAEGQEHGTHQGLGWLDGHIAPLAHDTLPIPHMGWNALEPVDVAGQPHPVFDGLEHGEHAYVVHSYAITPTDPTHVLAKVHYGGEIIAAIGRDNMVGTQFHPEKSQLVGLRLIANFLNWTP